MERETRQPSRRSSPREQSARRDRDYGLGVLVFVSILLIAGLVLGGMHLYRLVSTSVGQDTDSYEQSGVAIVAEGTGVGGWGGGTPLEEGRIVMTLCGSHETIVRTGESYVEPGCLVRDVQEGNLTDRVQVSGTVDTSTPGTYTITYTVENGEGMRATAQRTVRVTDDVDAGWDEDGISVLMYHYVYDPDDVPDDVDANYVSTVELEEQLAWLADEGFYFPSWAELRAYVDGGHSLPDKSVVLTFDDAAYSFLELGIPLLEQYQVPATSFTECSRGDIEDVLSDFASPYVCFESHSYDLHHAGYSGIGHGGAIYDLSEDELADDLQQAVDILGTSGAFAYPYGDVSDVSSAAIERVGILCSFTTDYDRVYPGDDPTCLSRIRVSGGNSLEYYQGSVW